MRSIEYLGVLIALVSAQPATMTADQLAARYVAATGGAAAWEAVRTFSVQSRSEFYSFDLLAKKPNKVRHTQWADTPSEADSRAFDGLTGWRVNPREGTDKPRSLSTAEIEELWCDRDWMMELVDYRARGYKLERIGIENVGGRPSHKLKVTRPDGNVVYLLLDAETFLEVRRVRPARSPDGQDLEIVMDVSDYRREGGVLLPHRVGPATRQYAINAAIPDSTFARPGVAEADRAKSKVDAAIAGLLKVGTQAPEWTLTDPEGRPHRSADLKGQIIVMDFWAVWCAPCHRMMPGLQTLHTELSRRGVTVLAISTFETNGEPAALMRDRGYTYQLLLHGEALKDTFHVGGLPTVYVIGADGRIIDASAGADDGAERHRRQVIDTELKRLGRNPESDAKEAVLAPAW